MSAESERDLEPDPLSDLPYPSPPASWRERLEAGAEALDLSLPRLVVGALVLAVLGVVGWRVLAPPSSPPEMTLPMVSGTEQGPADGDGAPAVDEVEPATATPEGGASGEADSGRAAQPVGASSRAEVVVHVAGAVHQPGVQRLDAGARIVDAVDAAGGATGDADLARVNLAAPVEDGHQVYIPKVGEEPPQPLGTPGSDAGAVGAEGSPGGGSGGSVNVNTAGVDQLETLHGIGPTIAQAIVDHRDEHGPFASVEQLADVRGIGEAKLEGLRDDVTV